MPTCEMVQFLFNKNVYLEESLYLHPVEKQFEKGPLYNYVENTAIGGN
jgi:hypothetical protein